VDHIYFIYKISVRIWVHLLSNFLVVCARILILSWSHTTSLLIAASHNDTLTMGNLVMHEKSFSYKIVNGTVKKVIKRQRNRVANLSFTFLGDSRSIEYRPWSPSKTRLMDGDRWTNTLLLQLPRSTYLDQLAVATYLHTRTITNQAPFLSTNMIKSVSRGMMPREWAFLARLCNQKIRESLHYACIGRIFFFWDFIGRILCTWQYLSTMFISVFSSKTSVILHHSLGNLGWNKLVNQVDTGSLCCLCQFDHELVHYSRQEAKRKRRVCYAKDTLHLIETLSWLIV
jgi:hypothetical protein